MLGQALTQYLWEPSYPERLAALLQDVDQAAPGVAGRPNRWKTAVATARIGFAHSLKKDPAEHDVQAWHVLAQSLRWLLTARLLLPSVLSPPRWPRRTRGTTRTPASCGPREGSCRGCTNCDRATPPGKARSPAPGQESPLTERYDGLPQPARRVRCVDPSASATPARAPREATTSTTVGALRSLPA